MKNKYLIVSSGAESKKGKPYAVGQRVIQLDNKWFLGEQQYFISEYKAVGSIFEVEETVKSE